MPTSSPARPGDLARHSISVVAARTGLSQDVLRVWERRYGVVQPTRTPGGQRLYSDADIERLRLLRQATQVGRGIAQLAPLSADELRELVAADREIHEPGAAPRDAATGELVGSALASARRFDAAGLREMLHRSAARFGFREFLEDIAVPLLRTIGDEWHAGRMTPAEEHLVTSEVHDVITSVMRDFPRSDGAPKMLVATPAGERHVVGAAHVGAAAAVEGWNVLYLGADLPASAIAHAAREAGASVVALSVVYVDDAERVVADLRSMRESLPRAVRLVVGGEGGRRLASRLTPIGVEVVTDAHALAASLRVAHAQ